MDSSPQSQITPTPPRKSYVGNRASIDSKISSDGTIRSGITGFKSTVSKVFRSNLFSRHPADMRLNKLRGKGFVMPSDRDVISMRKNLHRAGSNRSQNSTHSRLTARSGKSVYSIRSVRRIGNTPDIFITQPTNRGRRSYALHRGHTPLRPPTAQRSGIRHVRYYHPSVTAVIPNGGSMHQSQEAYAAPTMDIDQVSIVSIPKTADMARDFPGAVNIKQIARDTEINFEHAKAAVDGLFSKRSTKSTEPTALEDYLKERHFSAVSSNAIGVVQSASTDNQVEQKVESTIVQTAACKHSPSICKHRQNALISLCGSADAEAGASYDDVPTSLTPRGQPYARKSTASASFVLAADSATFFDDRDARRSYVSASSAYVSPRSSVSIEKPRQLQYLAYRPSLDLSTHFEEKSAAGSESWPVRVDSANAHDLRHLYERIEKLENGLEEIDGSLVGCMQQATRVHSMVGDATEQIFIRPAGPARIVDTTRSKIPQRHSMLDNGFPILNPSRESFSAEPAYTKRTLTGDELKALQKEERRKAALQNGEKQRREANRATKVKKQTRAEDLPLIDRMLAKLNF